MARSGLRRAQRAVVRTLVRMLVRVLVASLAAGPAHATDLSDVPLTVPPSAKPNLMLVLDDSGSMGSEFLPDSVGSAVEQCFKYFGTNRQYYNPAVTYQVALNADGSAFPEPTAEAAFDNPFAGTNIVRNLTRGAGIAWNNTNAFFLPAGGSLTGPCSASTAMQAVRIGDLTAAQQRNFAIWYSYHRSRLLAVKTALSRVFARLDGSYRVGMHLINAETLVRIDDFDACAASNCTRNLWYSTLFGVLANGTTPLIDAYARTANYFSTGQIGGAGTALVPVTHACQRNFIILATDGMWNIAPTERTDYDRTVPVLPSSASGATQTAIADPVAAGGTLTAGLAFPNPYRGPADGVATLGDLAMKHWITDLAPFRPNVLPATASDPANWQHIVTHAISLGIRGRLDNSRLADVVNGTLSWPQPVANEETTLDDLWHATVNGHGSYYSASDTNAFASAMADLLTSVPTEAASAALGLSTPQVVTGSATAYLASYDPTDWSGELRAFPIDAATGLPNLAAAPLWSAAAQLNARTSDTRIIASWSDDQGKGVLFRSVLPGNAASGLSILDPTQVARFSTAGRTDSPAVISYLRGDRSNEFNAQTMTGRYRRRQGLLGDIVDAAPAYVGPPTQLYSDVGYADFKSTESDRRTAMVVAAANDGMLHVFSAATGDELWAYVPGALIRMPYTSDTVTRPDATGLALLAERQAFVHRQYANGTPVIADVDLLNTRAARAASAAASPATSLATSPTTPPPTRWRTMLVAGLNKGGRGYYALDLSGAAPTSGAEAVGRVLWEFPRNASDPAAGNVGYTYGKPVIVKTAAAGWVVLVTSGYDNNTGSGDGRGRLFVLDAATGAVNKEFITPAGTVQNPSGLAQISAYAERARYDNTTTAVYGGDLLGNVWRFDLSAAKVDDWPAPYRLATLTDSAGAAQPVTTTPELAKVNGGTMVLVSTGRMLGASDLPGAGAANQTQSIYGLKDAGAGAATIVRANLTAGSALAAGTTTVGSATVDTTTIGALGTPPANARGWVVDLPRVNERAVTDGVLARGVFTQATVLPRVYSPCTADSTSYVYNIAVATGQVSLVRTLGQGFATGVTDVRTNSNGVEGVIVLSGKTGLSMPKVPVTPPPGAAGIARLLWRELIDQ